MFEVVLKMFELFEDIGILPVREIANFSPSTIQTGSLSKNAGLSTLKEQHKGILYMLLLK